jgi:hypothetical protein
MQAIEHAEKEIVAGRLWRAKEILQGSLRNAGYDIELFEKLGVVLLTMGDLPQAGRYLFLSARRDEKYDEAITLFISRYGNNARALFQTFPRVAKLRALADYPEPLREDLRKLGLPEKLADRVGRTFEQNSGGRFNTLIGLLILGAVVVVLILGVIKIVEIFRWLMNG